MRKANAEREVTVYISRDEAEFQRVKTELDAEGVRFRVWTTSEYPVFGWTRLDPRLISRREGRLRQVYHIEVAEGDRPNLIAANQIIRRLTGKMENAVPASEII